MHRPGTFRCAALIAVLCPLSLGAATQTYDYEYDASGRLIEVRTESSVIAYEYDAAGTIITRVGGPNLKIFDDGFEEEVP